MKMQAVKSESLNHLAAAGMRAYPNIARVWGLTDVQAATLLGTPPSTYRRWKRHPERANLDVNHLERLSLILGIYKNLHILLPRPEAADSWVLRPNSNPLFSGQPPIDRMLAGQVGDLVAVRHHLDGARG